MIEILKNKSIKSTKLIIFKIFYKVLIRNKIVIIIIIKIFFNYLNFFNKIIKVYFKLKLA